MKKKSSVALMKRDIISYPLEIPTEDFLLFCEISGDPKSKQRARFSSSGRVFTPKQTRITEEVVRFLVKDAMKDEEVDAVSSFGVRMGFFLKTFQRRDVDNMTKLILDALNKVVWMDDSQVVEIHAWKSKDENNPRTELVIYKIKDSNMASPNMIRCEVCRKEFRTYPSWRFRKFCGQKCMALSFMNGIDTVCTHCDKNIHRSGCRLKYFSEDKDIFCSKKCMSDYVSDTFQCATCEVYFKRARSLTKWNKKFCSLECYGMSRKKASSEKKKYGACLDCGDGLSKATYSRCAHCSAINIKKRSPGSASKII